MSNLYKKIEELCASRGESITAMCKASGASRGSLTDLKNGRISGLNLATMTRIAEHFEIPLDELASASCLDFSGRTIKTGDGHLVASSAFPVQVDSHDLNTQKLLSLSRDMTDEEKRQLLLVARLIIEQRSEK